MYCTEEFIQVIYRTLAEDQEFVEMLRSEWHIKLAESTIIMYRALVMHREPLVRTDSGYHVPSSEEIIAGIRAYFDPVHPSGDATLTAMSEDSNSSQVRAEVVGMLQN